MHENQLPRPHDTTSIVLIETSYQHPAGTCGQRIRSPHPRCQADLDPFMAAERFVLRYATLIRCHCGTTWRETQLETAA